MKHKLEWPSGHLGEYWPKQNWEKTRTELRNKISSILWTKFFNSYKEPSRCKSNSRIAQKEIKGRPIKCPKLQPPHLCICLPSFPPHHFLLLNYVRDPQIETTMPTRLQTLPGSWTAYHVPFQSWGLLLCSVASVISESWWPHGLQPTRLSVHGILQARRKCHLGAFQRTSQIQGSYGESLQELKLILDTKSFLTSINETTFWWGQKMQALALKWLTSLTLKGI